MNTNLLLADLVAFLHLTYVGFVVLGLVAILAGRIASWEWVRNRWFRSVHLAMIGIVVFESLFSITCPLTTLENYLRLNAGQSMHAESFMGSIIHQLLFFDLEPSTFTLLYCGFGLLVVSTLYLVPVRWSRCNRQEAEAQ